MNISAQFVRPEPHGDLRNPRQLLRRGLLRSGFRLEETSPCCFSARFLPVIFIQSSVSLTVSRLLKNPTQCEEEGAQHSGTHQPYPAPTRQKQLPQSRLGMAVISLAGHVSSYLRDSWRHPSLLTHRITGGLQELLSIVKEEVGFSINRTVGTVSRSLERPLRRFYGR